MTPLRRRDQIRQERFGSASPRYFLDLPDTGAAFFLRTALLATIALWSDGLLQRNDSHSPNLSPVDAIGPLLIGLFLLLSLGFYLWERRLRRVLHERMVARHDAWANRSNVT